MTHKKRSKVPVVEIRKDQTIENWQKDTSQKVTELATEFDVPQSSLYHRTRGRRSRQQAAETRQLFSRVRVRVS